MGDYSRTCFATWKKKSDEYAEYQKRWGRFFKRALNIKMAAGFQAWVTFYRFTQLPPEEALAHVRAQMAKYKAEMEAQKRRNRRPSRNYSASSWRPRKVLVGGYS